MAEKQKDSAKEYKAEDIKKLEGLEAVRKRPAMYIGSTGKEGLHHLVWEVVDNSVDECLAGVCSLIKITINKDGSLTVEDNGRGIPVETHPEYKKSALEIVITELHAGGKFDHKAYAISGGLHGVGISVVAALSKKLIVEVMRNGKTYMQSYKIGKPLHEVKVIGVSKEGATGTKVTFYPDEEIFSIIEFDFSVLATRFREIAFLNAGLKMVLEDKRKEKKEEFCYIGGLIEFVKWINRSKEEIHKPVYFKKQTDSVVAEVAVQYNSGYQENVFGFVNTINTVEGGTHLIGFRTALTRVINDYAQKQGIIKEKGELTGDDVREGLTAVVSIKIPNPQFEGQTKTKLGNSELKGIIDSICSSALSEFFEENPQIARKIAQKASEAAKAREAARKAKELVRRKGAFGFSGLPGKLADCSSKKIEETELYIVEGESAAGSSKQARNKEIQAILPLKGKILNVEKAAPTKVLSSEEVTNLITAIGTGIGEQFNLEKLRYGKIIIMTDADSVTADTPLLMCNNKGELIHQYIGEFVDSCLHPEQYQISSFSINPGEHKMKRITNIVKHPLKTSLYNIKTNLGYNVNVTPYHSVFVYNPNKKEVSTKATKDISPKDYILLPKKLPRSDKNAIINLKNLAKEYGIYAEFFKKELTEIPEDSYVDLPILIWKKLQESRENAGISREKLGRLLNVYNKILQQWESKIDNVMPRYGLFKRYLSIINYQIDNIDCRLLVPIKFLKEEETVNRKFYLNNHTHEIKLEIRLDENLAYVLGWYIGDGSASKGKKNPYRFSLCLGGDKVQYLERIKNAIQISLGCNIILEERKSDAMIHFNSLSFELLLQKFGLNSKKSFEKFVPDVIYNLKEREQICFLKGLLQSDGAIIVGNSNMNKAVLDHTTVSKKLMEGIVFLYRQLGFLPSIIESKSKDHYYNNTLIKSNYKKYDILLGSIIQLEKAKEIWQDHKNADKLIKFIENAKKHYDRKFVVDVNENFQAVKVLKVERIERNDKFVYDLSVDLNRSFIGGLGGLTLHNTDGSHIRTLLLTFFFRFMPQLIENGNIHIAVSPLYRIRKKRDHYVYSEGALKRVLDKLGAANVTRFKGLGEMNPQQLWETTMNPATRMLKKVAIEDAVEADRIFSVLMGDDVGPRKQFIEEHAHEAMLDI